MSTQRHVHICIVGSGTRFLSGISYYTLRLANEMSVCQPTSVILMRQLLPTFLYPGRSRVGKPLTSQTFLPSVSVFDGVDWYWIPSLIRGLAFLVRQKPDVVLFQWWTGAVLHSYLMIALVARLLRMKVFVEFHEVQDTGEAKLFLAKLYVNYIFPILLAMASGFVVHSSYDKDQLEARFDLARKPITLIPHGPYDQHISRGEQARFRKAPAECCNLLFFGVIRPYKGLEDLILAFDAIPKTEISKYWLTVVGESWEGYTLPLELIENSHYRERITLINRYVADSEVSSIFAGADVVILPYHRSSASGPLEIAMCWGLPIITTQVGGLIEAVQHYENAVLVPPRCPDQITDAILRCQAIKDRSYSSPHSWKHSVEAFMRLVVQGKYAHED